jgi:hypothetical protein
MSTLYPLKTRVLIPAIVIQSDPGNSKAAPDLTVRLETKDHMGRDTELLLHSSQVIARVYPPDMMVPANEKTTFTVSDPLIELYDPAKDYRHQANLAVHSLELHEAELDLLQMEAQTLEPSRPGAL